MGVMIYPQRIYMPHSGGSVVARVVVAIPSSKVFGMRQESQPDFIAISPPPLDPSHGVVW